MRKAERFEASYSPGRLLLLSLLAAGFVCAGLWMIGFFGEVPESRRLGPDAAYAIGWLAIIFFGACAVALVRRVFSGGVAITIDNYGIHDRRISSRPIRWDDIEQIGSYAVSGNKFVGFALRDPERAALSPYARITAGMNRSMTGFPYAIGATGTDTSHAQILAAIEHFAP